jgi:serine/threonine-protein kinase
MKREVALKTILDVDNQTALDLFYKEWGVQASIVHPNIVGIYDIGEFDDNGVSKPFFVMPLLPGVTLEQLIRESSTRLDSDTVISMICQACRGLQAAHEHGLVHRDMKPSNIFVIDDDSVKLIDFGVVHVVGSGSRTNMKGTLAYMSPEQVKFKSPTVLSDEFSLAVVCYEALSRRRPFRGASDEEISDAILNHIPVAVSELNSDAPHQVSQVIHKALAKNPWHRFPTVREFGESLQKAVRLQPIEYFDEAKVKPRIQKAQAAFEEGDHAFANEVLSELEGEGHLDGDITMLRGKLNQALKQTRIQALLEGARRFVGASEYSLALRKVQEALEIDPRDPDVLALQLHIEKNRHQTQIQEWFRLCQQHIENRSFQQARDAVANVIKTRPNDTQALELMAEIDRRENDLVQTRREEYDLYEAARDSWERGEVTSALSKLEHLIAIERHRPRTDSGRGATYQKFYNQVRSERDGIKNAYERARADMENGNFEAALSVCRQFLAKYPTHALFHSLKFDVEERSRQKLSSYIAEIDQKVEAEPDLDRRLAILDEAIERYPGEKHFERARALVRDKRELVDAIVAKARYYEEHDQFAEALDQWQTLARIHHAYQGIDFELERLEKRRRRQAEQTARGRWIDQIERCLETGDYKEAVSACAKSLEEFPNDAELTELERLAQKNAARRKDAMELVSEARGLLEAGKPAEGLEVVQRARKLDERSPVVRAILLNTLFECARADAKSSPDKAQEHLDQILAIDPVHSMALSLRAELHSERQDEQVGSILAQARRLQAEDDAPGALAVVDEGLKEYPDDTRLSQLRVTLNRTSEEVRSRRYRDLQEAIHLDEMAVGATDPSRARILLNRAQ